MQSTDGVAGIMLQNKEDHRHLVNHVFNNEHQYVP